VTGLWVAACGHIGLRLSGGKCTLSLFVVCTGGDEHGSNWSSNDGI
jgi:hypothetical protein